jgi:N-methylhydantoinase A
VDRASLDAAVAEFERRYARLYGAGSGFREAGIHGITFRVRGVGVLNVAPRFHDLADAATANPAEALLAQRPVCLDGRVGFRATPVYDYRLLRAGHVILGPAIIQVPTTSVVIPAGMRGVIDRLGNLRIATGGAMALMDEQRSAA